MTEHRTPRDEPFLRAAAFVGDLGNPFYDEERNRDVWNEASAVGFQLVLWLGLVTSAAAVWVVGAEAVPYALALYAIIGVASWVTLLYAERLGVRVVDAPERLRRLRLLPYGVLLVVLLAGIVVRRGSWPDDALGSFAAGLADGTVLGAVVGAAAVVLPLVVLVRRSRRSSDAADADPT